MQNIHNVNNEKISELDNLIKDKNYTCNIEDLRNENTKEVETIPKILFSLKKNPESSNSESEAEDLIEKVTNNVTKKKEKRLFFTPQFQVYVSHFLSSWGDRMWMFAGGLFLIEITPGSLRLVAIYEASRSLTVIFLGSAVGRWVDRTSRLTAAQSSLILQNSMVCACTILLCLMTTYKSYFHISLYGWGDTAAQVGVVFLTCISQIGSLASKLAIEKDWIIVISEQSDSQLSTMNSVLRTVDLSTEMMAPVLVGFVMSSSGMVAGGIVIAVWNVISFVIEYGLLHILYKKVVALQKPKQGINIDSGKKAKIFTQIKEKVTDAASIWKSYFHHSIRDAGLGLAVLYMTVLALDNYSRTYVYENGVSKGILGILTACASLSGILGSIAFPFLRRKLGVLGTGIFGFTFESLCLILCVASVFAPGSFFIPGALFSDNSSNVSEQTMAESQHQDYNKTMSSTIGYSNISLDLNVNNVSIYSSEYNEGINNTKIVTDYTSVTVLLTGIITSRLGLWLADLTVTQILQEEVAENERGGINGVQSSLNQSFSLLTSLLLIMLPTLATFGYLIILSFAFVVFGTLLFCFYSFKKKRRREITISENVL